MIISNKLLLADFVRRHSQAVRPLNKWLAEVSVALWKSHNDLKTTFPSADYIGNSRYVFNIGGDKYRIVAFNNTDNDKPEHRLYHDERTV